MLAASRMSAPERASIGSGIVAVLGEVVLVDGAMYRIDLDSRCHVETSLLEAEAEPTSTREEVDPDGSHGCGAPVRRRRAIRCCRDLHRVLIATSLVTHKIL